MPGASGSVTVTSLEIGGAGARRSAVPDAVTRVALCLDSEGDDAFARLTSLATAITGARAALVSLIDSDRLHFRGHVGLPEPFASLREAPLSNSFCEHVVDTAQPLVVEDARSSALHRQKPAFRELGVVAYLGLPLVSPDGAVLGTLCLIDTRPRVWTLGALTALRDVAASVLTEIEVRIALRDIERHAAEAERRAREKVETLEATADGFLALSHEGRVLYANTAASRVLNRGDAGALGGQVLWALLPRSVGRELEDLCRLALSLDQPSTRVISIAGSGAAPAPRRLSVRASPAGHGIALHFSSVSDPAVAGPAPAGARANEARVTDFDALYDAHAPAVYGFLLSLADAGTATRLLVETFRVAARRAGLPTTQPADYTSQDAVARLRRLALGLARRDGLVSFP